LTTKKVAMPIKKEMTMLMATAIPKPVKEHNRHR
jgi:hypothetical protein